MSRTSTNNRLRSFTKNKALIAELTAYTANSFCPDSPLVDYRDKVDLQDEPQVATWEKYLLESKTIGVYETLKKYFVQFQFPIKESISQTTEYKNATLKGASTIPISQATGLVIREPEKLILKLHSSMAGKIPVLIANNRCDFQTIVQALCYRNEPKEMPTSMGAAMIKGLNNWDRLRSAQRNFLAQAPASKYAQKELLNNKALYQDRIIVLGKTPYSNVPAEQLGVTPEDWLNKSLKIRLEHECAHYFTLRYFGKMSNNMHDELIADYMGIGAVRPFFNSNWFLHFIGLENYPDFRAGGRLKNYIGNPPLSTASVEILQTLLKKAADNLAIFDQQIYKTKKDRDRKWRLLSLCHLSLPELAAEEGVELLFNAYNSLQKGI